MHHQVITPRIKPNKLMSNYTGETYFTRYPSLNLGAASDTQDNILDEVLGTKINRHRKKYLAALQTIIYNLYTVDTALRKLSSEGTVGVLFSRDTTAYHNSSRYTAKYLSYRPFIRILNSLEDNKRIKVYKGFKSKRHAHGVPSTTELTKEGLAWLQDVIGDCHPVELDQEKELIYLNEPLAKLFLINCKNCSLIAFL